MNSMSRRLVLASASPARLRVLRAAGFDPEVVVSGVDEDDDMDDTTALVRVLAERKAKAVAAIVDDGIVIGCDSMFDFGKHRRGKPSTADEALAWGRSSRGKSGFLHTGHCVVDTRTERWGIGIATTEVRFGRPTDEELLAYIATGEPLAVAGGFTLDGRSAPFIDGVDGDPGNVIGISLPLVRQLLAGIDIRITDLWA